MNKGYVPLHLHTRIGSILDSMVNPLKEKGGDCLLAVRAKKLNMPAIAITDHGSMAGVLSHYKTCNEYGIKPILGCEFYICDDINVKDKDSKYYHLVVLAKNNAGYQNLKELSSIGYLDGFYYKPRIDFELLKKHSEGLVVSTACLASELDRMIMKDDYDRQDAVDLINKYKDVFKDDYYLEIQSSDTEDQTKANKEIIKLAKLTNTKLIVTTDVHFLNKEDFDAHNIFININQDRDTENYKYCYLQSRKEIVDILSYLDSDIVNEALDNTFEVADKCNVKMKLHEPKLPHLKVPIDYDDESDWLTDLTFEGLKKRGCYTKEYIERAKFELNVIITKGFEGYFLILMNIIKEAKKRGIPIGEGRGSAAGSIVAYALEITNVDSIEYDLDFGRFLTMERTELPDIDTDVATSRRDDLIDLIIEMFGYDNVCQIATFGTLASKAVIDAVGKVMGIDTDVRLMLKDKLNEDEGVKSLTKIKEYKEYKDYIDTCIKIEGCPRSVGSHAGGVCISGDNRPVVDYSPKMLNKDNRVISQFEMHDVEDCNLVKYDMLGLTSLDYIDDCLKFIGSDYYSFKFDYNDKATYDMLSEKRNTGVFQNDSNFAERVFTSVKPKSISEIADAVAIGRPDSVKFLEPYVIAKFKHKMPKQIHPLFNDILSKTYGCLIYQEQLMKIFKVFGGFSDGQADGVRKCVAKKKLDKMDYYFGLFREGAKKNGYTDDVIEQIIEFVKDNASYSFNASHAVAYGITTYKTAYLKCHYPVEYMAAIINNQKTEDGSTDFDKVKQYIKSAEQDGIKTTLPDVNTSGLKFTPNNGSIEYGLSLIKGLSNAGAKVLIDNRPYKSFKDFLERVGLLLGKSDVIALVKANAFRNISQRSQMEQFKMFYKFRFDNGKEDKKPIKKVNKTHIKYLLDNGLIEPDEADDTFLCTSVINDERKDNGWIDFKKKYCQGTSLQWEMETLNSYLSADPFENVYTGDWSKVENEHNGYVGGVLISVKETTTKKGDKMCFLNISRENKKYDIVVFPKNYLKYKPLLKAGNCIVCRTTKQGELKGIMQSCETLRDFVKRTRTLQKESVVNRYVET